MLLERAVPPHQVLSSPEFAAAVGFARLGGGSDGSWRGALGIAQRQIPAGMAGQGELGRRLPSEPRVWSCIVEIGPPASRQLGWTFRSTSFTSMQLMAMAKWPVAYASGEARSCRSSPRSHLAWSALRAARLLTTGRGKIRQLGHDVRLIQSAYVKPYVRRGAQNDAADAAAICQAVTRQYAFVLIKSVENQGFLMLHRARGLLVRQRTMTACAIRAHFAEFGIIVGQGRQRVDGLADLLDDEELTLPRAIREALREVKQERYHRR